MSLFYIKCSLTVLFLLLTERIWIRLQVRSIRSKNSTVVVHFFRYLNSRSIVSAIPIPRQSASRVILIYQSYLWGCPVFYRNQCLFGASQCSLSHARDIGKRVKIRTCTLHPGTWCVCTQVGFISSFHGRHGPSRREGFGTSKGANSEVKGCPLP